MNASWVQVAGFAAAFCTTVAFVPQLLRVLRRRSADDISLPMFVLFSLGVLLWLVYGLAVHSWPVIVSNAATLGLSLAILVLKLRYDSHAVKQSNETASPSVQPGRWKEGR